jgi:diaminohydroxyphosphoribosylaminopyrimidine deaminase / 5-amino-6-(5-phosphoribosylamino)uracil reductase
MWNDADIRFMERALHLAERALLISPPNPSVGCLLVRDGLIIGEGFTQATGQAHAEARALQDCLQHSESASGATAYVTLEPCSHTGRTPPCANALIDAKVSRVVIAMLDPNPLVSGAGVKRLQDAGINVELGCLEAQAAELNRGFISRMTRARPWVRLKVAVSIDGKTALPNRRSQWITSAAARADGHWWRARACAVLTGIGTVKDDDPQLNVRAIETPRQPKRILIDSRLEVPLQAKVLGPSTLVYCAELNDNIDTRNKISALQALGCEVKTIANAQGKVDLALMLLDLGQRDINTLHIEAGFKLNGSLLAAGCVDELLVYQAPIVLGDGIGMFDLAAAQGIGADLPQERKLGQICGCALFVKLSLQKTFTSKIEKHPICLPESLRQ